MVDNLSDCLSNPRRVNPYADAVKYAVKEDEKITKMFDTFARAEGFKNILDCFESLCEYLQIDRSDYYNLYSNIKSKLNVWRARALFVKLDAKIAQGVYENRTACKNARVFVIGGGPCGLRSAIEVALMGGKAVVVEKRTYTTRNNVLSLWPFVVEDLKFIGAKDFFPGFCVGGKDHISIKQCQNVLLKIALMLGVEVYVDVLFIDLVEPPDDQSTVTGWRCSVEPSDHPVTQYQFNTIIGADGKKHGLSGFKRKQFRGKLAIAITANFINRRTKGDAMVPEICGLSYLFDQQFFKDLKKNTDIDLENIVYFKAPTHYFVFAAKTESLLLKGVLKENHSNPADLLCKDNVNKERMLAYAKQTANESTKHKLPDLEFSLNKDGEPDVAIFDFTRLCHAEYSSRVVERKGHRLLATVVGDSLLEPFWPSGTGAAYGFLGVFDSAWMIRQWFSGQYSALEVLAERETIFTLLPQCSVSVLFKNIKQYTMDPKTRYKTFHTLLRNTPGSVKHQYDGEDNSLIEKILPGPEEVITGPEQIRSDSEQVHVGLEQIL